MFLFGQPACIDGVVMNGQWGAYRCGASDATDSQPENPLKNPKCWSFEMLTMQRW